MRHEDSRGPWQVKLDGAYSDQLWGDDPDELRKNIADVYRLTGDEYDDMASAVGSAFRYGYTRLAGWIITEIDDSRPEEDPYDY